MDALIQALQNFLQNIVDRTGTKFALAIVTIIGDLYLVYKGGIPGSLGIPGTIALFASQVAINVGYFIWRRAQEKEQIAAVKLPLPGGEGAGAQ